LTVTRDRQHYSKTNKENKGAVEEMTRAKIKKVSRITNASALARELGVGREHLWRVVTGRRISRRLATELKKRGIAVSRRAGSKLTTTH